MHKHGEDSQGQNCSYSFDGTYCTLQIEDAYYSGIFNMNI